MIAEIWKKLVNQTRIPKLAWPSCDRISFPLWAIVQVAKCFANAKVCPIIVLRMSCFLFSLEYLVAVACLGRKEIS